MKQMRPRPLYLLALGLPIALSACVSFARPRYQPVVSEVVPAPGFRIDRPVAIVDPRGLRFHGWICRNVSGVGRFSPRALRVERIDGRGEIVSHAKAGVYLSHRPDCTIYDIPTSWTLPPEERVRLCAADGDRTCPSVPSDDRRDRR